MSKSSVKRQESIAPNARLRALDRFVCELEGYIDALVESGKTSFEAIDEAMLEYDEFWRALFEEEIEKERLVAK